MLLLVLLVVVCGICVVVNVEFGIMRVGGFDCCLGWYWLLRGCGGVLLPLVVLFNCFVVVEGVVGWLSYCGSSRLRVNSVGRCDFWWFTFAFVFSTFYMILVFGLVF